VACGTTCADVTTETAEAEVGAEVEDSAAATLFADDERWLLGAATSLPDVADSVGRTLVVCGAARVGVTAGTAVVVVCASTVTAVVRPATVAASARAVGGSQRAKMPAQFRLPHSGTSVDSWEGTTSCGSYASTKNGSVFVPKWVTS